MENEKWIILLITTSNDNFMIRNSHNHRSNHDVQYSSLPTALYPLCGVPIIDTWLSKLSKAFIPFNKVFVLTNQKHYSKFTEWGQSRSIPYHNIIVSDAIGEVESIRMMFDQHYDLIVDKNVLVVKVDILVDFELSLSPFFNSSCGMFLSTATNNNPNIILDENNFLQHSSSDAFNSYFLPIYSILCNSFQWLAALPQSVNHSIELITNLSENYQIPYQATHVSNYYPINSNESFDHATSYLELHSREILSHLPSHVNIICPARAGLMGNPSDGFHGKTLSFIVNNFCAQVTITANPTLSVILVPHAVFDITHFSCFDTLHKETQLNGYYGGLRLLKATCRSFARRCCQLGLLIHLQRGFTISYDTSIPRRVGLSGSSAIITAAYKALMEFFGLTLHDLQFELPDFPQVILDIEREELGIAAGLQDRVIQTYGGIVHMDFTRMSTESRGIYTPLDASLLPELYLLYNIEEGGDSGKVHSTAKSRWLNGDHIIIAGMKELGQLADQAKDCLIRGDLTTLATLMNKNFQLRRDMYGDDVVGKRNIAVANLANKLGFACKFTGSGGAFVCLAQNGDGWLPVDEEHRIREEFKREGFEFVRIEKLV